MHTLCRSMDRPFKVFLIKEAIKKNGNQHNGTQKHVILLILPQVFQFDIRYLCECEEIGIL